MRDGSLDIREVVDALFANPYQRVWGAKVSPLPVYDVTLRGLLGGIIPFVTPVFTRASRPLIRAPTCAGVLTEGVAPHRPSERGLHDRTMANHRRHPVFRLLRKGECGTRGRTLFNLLHRDAARLHAVALACRKAVSDERIRTTPLGPRTHRARGHRRRKGLTARTATKSDKAHRHDGHAPRRAACQSS